MLPTEDKSQIHYNKVRYPNEIKYELSFHKELSKCKNDGLSSGNQHLYITTDEEIKPFEKCWVFDSENNSVFYNAREENTKGLTHTNFFHKIIATTDLKLYITKDYTGYGVIPQIPQSFIEEYCKAGGMDEVLVECTGGRWDYKRYCPFKSIETKGKTDYVWVIGVAYDSIKHLPKDKIRQTPIEPKTDSNNCIIIHPVEEKMYSEKEAIENAHGLLAKKLGLKELEFPRNRWVNQAGEHFTMTAYGFRWIG